MTQNPEPWVPQACTLPTAERPFRLAEFDALFTTDVTAVERIGADRARFELRPQAEVAARAADLSVRETVCCSFFEFSVVATGGRLTLDVHTPAQHRAVLDAVVDRARAVTGPAA